MKVCIASLKFSPGHLSHMLAYGKLFQKIGYQVCFYLDINYKKMIEEVKLDHVFYFGKDSVPSCDVIFFANVSQFNYILADQLRKMKSKIIYLYHEPFDRVSHYLKEGVKQTIKAIGAHYFSVKTLKSSDLVIVPSNYALELYKMHDIKYCRNVQIIPLLFDDESDEEPDISKKEYFSYIGHAVKGHAFHEYLEFVQYSYEAGEGLKFQIATRTDLTPILKKCKLLTEMINEGKLKIIHGRALLNREINEAYMGSFSIWNIYKRSTQSGVLPKAFMFGTPVIANKIGSFPEFVKDDYDGYLLDENIKTKHFKTITEKIIKIKDNLLLFSKNARATFLDKFYYKSYVGLMQELMNRIW